MRACLSLRLCLLLFLFLLRSGAGLHVILQLRGLHVPGTGAASSWWLG